MIAWFQILIYTYKINKCMQTLSFDSIRHQLHQHPELSGQERETARFIEASLRPFHPTKIIRSIGGHGLLAEYFFSEEGPTLLFRADIDAVAIDEPNDIVPYGSLRTGVSHKCGHDGHTAILLRLAQMLFEKPMKQGRVLLLFQPAEETGSGSSAILADLVLPQYNIQYAFALHNIPGFPTSTVLCKPGSFTCSVISAAITLSGKTAHAAEPLKAISPVNASFKIIETLTGWNRYDIEKEDYFLSTLVEIHIGEEAYGVAAGTGVIRVTLRAKTDQQLRQHMQKLEKLVEIEASETPGLSSDIKWLESFSANENDPQAVQHIRKAAANNGLPYREMNVPFSWGEDFGLFTQQYKGAMFGLGAGKDCPPLHSPQYDFPDELIESGAGMFYSIAQKVLDKK